MNIATNVILLSVCFVVVLIYTYLESKLEQRKKDAKAKEPMLRDRALAGGSVQLSVNTAMKGKNSTFRKLINEKAEKIREDIINEQSQDDYRIADKVTLDRNGCFYVSSEDIAGSTDYKKQEQAYLDMVNLDNLEAVTPELVSRVQNLVKDVDVDINTPLVDEKTIEEIREQLINSLKTLRIHKPTTLKVINGITIYNDAYEMMLLYGERATGQTHLWWNEGKQEWSINTKDTPFSAYTKYKIANK